MNPSDYFLELNTKSEHISKQDYNMIEWPWIEHIGWQAVSLELDIIDKEPLLKKINERFEIEALGVLKMEPYSMYNWHVDDDRGVAVNLILTPEHNSHCIFTKKSREKRRDMFPILELDYKKDTFYVFNTQELHNVMNLSGMRYMFSLMFKDKKDKLSYNEVKQYCIDNNI